MALVMSMDNSSLILCFKQSEAVNLDLSRFRSLVGSFNVLEFLVSFCASHFPPIVELVSDLLYLAGTSSFETVSVF